MKSISNHSKVNNNSHFRKMHRPQVMGKFEYIVSPFQQNNYEKLKLSSIKKSESVYSQSFLGRLSTDRSVLSLVVHGKCYNKGQKAKKLKKYFEHSMINLSFYNVQGFYPSLSGLTFFGLCSFLLGHFILKKLKQQRFRKIENLFKSFANPLLWKCLIKIQFKWGLIVKNP